MAAFGITGITSITRTALRATAALTIAFGAAACGDDPNESRTQRFNIVSIGLGGTTDNTAPFLIAEGTDPILGTYKFEIASGYIELLDNNRYRAFMDFNATLGGQPFPFDETPEEGTYMVSGNSYTFDPAETPSDPDDDTTPFTATLSGGNTLTFTEEVTDLNDEPVTLTIVARK